LKQIQAFIRPEKLDDVKASLVDLNINGMTAISVQGFGKQMGYPEVYRGVKIEARLLPKILLQVVVKDESLTPVIEAIRASAQTGSVGDGKIIVSSVEDVVRIRTGESGDAALS
jgi:nitrogen regulatory protein P-II 1